MKQTLLLTLFAATLAAPALQAQETPTLVAYYPFNGNANDSSAFANNATVSGAELTEGWDGKANGAYAFDGVLDSIVAPPAQQLNTNTATYAFWVRADELVTEGESYLFFHGGWQERMKASLPSHGRPVFTTNTDAEEGAIKDMDALTEVLEVGTWTHVAMVHNTDSNFIYVNGVLAHSIEAPGNLNPTQDPVVFGSDGAGTGGQRFTGALDEFRIYSSALNAATIQGLYNEYKASVSTEDIAFAQLGRVFPNPASDQVTLDHQLALDGSASLQLIDATGRQVFSRPLRQEREVINVSQLPTGIYTLRVLGKDVRAATRIIVR